LQRTDKIGWYCGRSYWQPLNSNVRSLAKIT
jgi:hypothetical protein